MNIHDIQVGTIPRCELQKAKGVCEADDQVSIYAQSVAEKCKKGEPLRLRDVDSDSDVPEWMLVSADSEKVLHEPPAGSIGLTNDRAVDEVQRVQKEYRDSEPFVC